MPPVSAVCNPAWCRPGDILLYAGHESQSLIIRLGTVGRYSHLALIAGHPADPSRLLVWETVGGHAELPPCVLQGRQCAGVQAHDVMDRVYGPHDVWLARLIRPLTDCQHSRLIQNCEAALGTPYDLEGAFHAHAGWLEEYWGKSDFSSLFCSEFVLYELAKLGLFRAKSVPPDFPELADENRREILNLSSWSPAAAERYIFPGLYGPPWDDPRELDPVLLYRASPV